MFPDIPDVILFPGLALALLFAVILLVCAPTSWGGVVPAMFLYPLRAQGVARGKAASKVGSRGKKQNRGHRRSGA